MFRFKLEDLPIGLRNQAERQIFGPNAKSRTSRQTPDRAADRPSCRGSNAEPPIADYRPSAPSSPPIVQLREGKMSGAERAFQKEVLGGRGLFEAITLHLRSGCRYTPDFYFIDGETPVLVEVKGSYRLGSEGRAFTAFREAASQFCHLFRFVWAVRQNDRSWKLSQFVDATAAAKPAFVSSSPRFFSMTTVSDPITGAEN